MKESSISQETAWSIWFLAALFYFYEYILRTAPSIMLPELSSYFNISHAGLGFLIGSYFYLYAPLQIVAGILTDIFGEKRILPMAVILCLVGSLLFILPHYYTALIGRLLIGAGSAFGFVAIIYVATNWIDRKHFSLIVGLTQALGMAGSILGQVGCVAIVRSYSWKYVWISSSVFGIILLIIFTLMLPGKPTFLNDFYHDKKISKTLENIKIVITNPQTWLASFFGGLIFIPTTVFAMLWGVPFFENVYHLERTQAANIMTLVFIGWIAGCPIAGIIEGAYKRYKPVMFSGLGCVLIIFITIAYVNMSHLVLMLMLFLMGLFSSVQILSFTVVKKSTPEFAKATAVGVTNFIIFSWTAVVTPLLGLILSKAEVYFSQSPIADVYRISMSTVVILLILAGVSLAFVKEQK